MGWREFMRACYLLRGRDERSGNFFKHRNKLPKGFWEGKTGIEPIDATIERVLKTGYCHHIERLMVLGNFLLLAETDPDAVYEWFMAFFVDAYDWVMVPNIYAMSQYADEGGITTKPYVSGSNYILKMSDYKKGEWCAIWDGLFWRFLSKHEKLFGSNPRTKNLLNLRKKNAKTIDPKIALAEEWIKQNVE
jgi:deoxyribodipyrimidine photolyase-related protein